MEVADDAVHPENPWNYLITAIMDYDKTPAATVTHCLECISTCCSLWSHVQHFTGPGSAFTAGAD